MNFPLHDYIERGFYNQIKRLIKNGIDVNSYNNSGKTPLHIAVEHNIDNKIIKLLLKYGSDIHSRDFDNETPLVTAAKTRNNTKIAKLLLKFEADPNSYGCCRYTALHYAVELRDNLKMIKLLIHHGANIEARDNLNWTPLHRAASIEDNEKNLLFLLQNHANIEAKNNRQWSPIQIALEKNYLDVVKCLIKFGASIKVLYPGEISLLDYAIIKQNLLAVKLLLSFGADVNFENYHKKRVIHFAIEHAPKYDVTILETLIEHGADISFRDLNNKTPLFHAVLSGNSRTIELLLKNGASLYCDEQSYKFLVTNVYDIPYRYNSICKVFYHTAKLLALDLLEGPTYVNNLFFPIRSERYLQKCGIEAEHLKALICIDFPITFRDLLTNNIRTVAYYLSNAKIWKGIEESNYQEKFPFYKDMLEQNIKKGFYMARLVRIKQDKCVKFFGSDPLPRICISQFEHYLNERQLRDFKI